MSEKSQPKFNKDGSEHIPQGHMTDWEFRQAELTTSGEDPFKALDSANEQTSGRTRKVVAGVATLGLAAGLVAAGARSIDQNAKEHYDLSHPKITHPNSDSTQP